MKATQKLHDLGQRIWIDHITRDLLDDGTLKRYIGELSVTGLTSNPTIFEKAIRTSTAYDGAIRAARAQARSGRALLRPRPRGPRRAPPTTSAPIHEETDGVDGWVSLEVSPLLAYDTASTLSAGRSRLHARAGRPNLFIKIPGTPEGVPAIEEAIFAGVPVNVTLLFSCEQYLAAAEAYLRGDRAPASPPGSTRGVASVASLFVSRWDAAVASDVPEGPQPARRRVACARTVRSAASSTRRAGGASPSAAAGRSACSLVEHRHEASADVGRLLPPAHSPRPTR